MGSMRILEYPTAILYLLKGDYKGLGSELVVAVSIAQMTGRQDETTR